MLAAGDTPGAGLRPSLGEEIARRAARKNGSRSVNALSSIGGWVGNWIAPGPNLYTVIDQFKIALISSAAEFPKKALVFQSRGTG